MSATSSQCCLQYEMEGEVLAKSRYLKSSVFSYLTRSHLTCFLGVIFIPSTHSSHLHMSKFIMIITAIIYFYFLSWLNIYCVSSLSETDLLGLDIMDCNEYSFWVIGNIVLNLHNLHSNSYPHNHSSCLETWLRITCLQMSFSVQSWMEWDPYTLLDMRNTCDPGKWFGWPWKLQLLSHFKNKAIQMIY